MKLPLRYFPKVETLTGATWDQIEAYYPGDRIRQIERASIRMFMEQNREYLRGRVLDFGAGQQPYRALVDGEYVPCEKDWFHIPGVFDTVMCNQVLQYVENPRLALKLFHTLLSYGGHLVMTYPTNWDEVEASDFWRFTQAGMAELLRETGFQIVKHERRAEVVLGNFKFPLGYGVVCTRG
jgi:SAM-dependent methyltransferase